MTNALRNPTFLTTEDLQLVEELVEEKALIKGCLIPALLREPADFFYFPEEFDASDIARKLRIAMKAFACTST